MPHPLSKHPSKRDPHLKIQYELKNPFGYFPAYMYDIYYRTGMLKYPKYTMYIHE